MGLTEDEAAAEVSTWTVHADALRPALITRNALWKDFIKADSTHSFPNSLLKIGVSTAVASLTGESAFDLITWASDAIKDAAVDKALDMTVEKGFDRITGAYLVDYPKIKSSFEEVDKKLAVKVTSGYLSILIGLAAGTFTLATGVGAATGVALAIIVWIGDTEDAKILKRRQKIVKSMMAKYEAIRTKKYEQVTASNRLQAERLVMSNAKTDLEDAGELKTYYWTDRCGRKIGAQFEASQLKTLWRKMVDLDSDLGQKLRILDLLEIATEYREETQKLWGVATKGPDFDGKVMKAFMQKQINGHGALDQVPKSKAAKTLAGIRRESIGNLTPAEVAQQHDDPDVDVIPEEGGISAAPGTFTFKPHAPH